MCILLFLRETDPGHVITTPHMMLMPQLITWTEITGNSLIIVPEKYWKNIPVPYEHMVQEDDVHPCRAAQKAPIHSGIRDKATEEPPLKAHCLMTGYSLRRNS